MVFNMLFKLQQTSPDLKNELMQLSDLRLFFRMWPLGIDDVLALFTWLYEVCHIVMDIPCKIAHESRADTAMKELSNIQSLWDRYLISTL